MVERPGEVVAAADRLLSRAEAAEVAAEVHWEGMEASEFLMRMLDEETED